MGLSVGHEFTDLELCGTDDGARRAVGSCGIDRLALLSCGKASYTAEDASYSDRGYQYTGRPTLTQSSQDPDAQQDEDAQQLEPGTAQLLLVRAAAGKVRGQFSRPDIILELTVPHKVCVKRPSVL